MYEKVPTYLGLQGSLSGAEFVCLCPLHRESHASFSFNVETGLWYCFTQCGGGTATQLLEHVKRLTPWEASRELLRLCGEGLARGEEEGREEERGNGGSTNVQRQRELTRAVPKWFLDRGFSLADARRWELRYDVSSHGLFIPLVTLSGIDFSQWILRSPPGIQPKYRNSGGLVDPYGPLMGGDGSPPLCITEGPLDALWIQKWGHSALSLLGTRQTDRLFAVLEEIDPPEICLALDNDEPGKKATERLAHKLLKLGYRVTTLVLPEGVKDVQEMDQATLSFAIENRISPLMVSKKDQQRLQSSMSLDGTERF